MSDNNHIYDVAILGSGGAGCAAAIEAIKITRNIVLITKARLSDSRTALAQGGIQAAIAEDDSPEKHFEDTIKAGGNKSNPELVKILTTNARETIQWLEKIGVSFDKNGDQYVLKHASGLSAPRVLSVGDAAGRGIVKAMLNEVCRLQIPFRENSGVSQILKSGDLFELTLCEKAIENSVVLKARTVILATGGAMPGDKKAGIAGNCEVPDGLTLAQRLGATVVNPDLMQYHPTGILFPIQMRRRPLPETMRGCGAVILNKHKKEFADSLAPRNELTQAIIEECRKGNGVETESVQGVWVDTARIDQLKGAGYTQKNFPTMHATFLENGHDLTREPVLVYPILHYTLGGVEIDVNSESNIKGFFAAGETTWGVHGTDRLMGNSLLDIFVFGRIAGNRAALFAKQQLE